MYERTDNAGIMRRVSWAAIFGGTFVAFGIQILLVLLGSAIGLAAINPAERGMTGITIGSGIWLIISGIIAFFCGSFVVGRLSGEPRNFDRVLNGFVMWGVAVAFTLYLATATAGSIVGGLFGILSGSGSNAGQVAPAASSVVGELLRQNLGGSVGALPSNVQAELDRVLSGSATPEEKALIQSDIQHVVAALTELGTQGQLSDTNRQNVVSVLVKRGKMSSEQANRRIDQWIRDYHQNSVVARENAAKAVTAATDSAAKATFLVFLTLLLQGVAAGLGAFVARPFDAQKIAKQAPSAVRSA